MKRLFAILLTAALLLAVLPVTAFAATPVYGPKAPSDKKVPVVTVTINRDKGNIALRKGPGYSYARNHVVKHGDKAIVLATDGKWSRVVLLRNGNKGWLRNHYIDGTCAALIKGVHMVIKNAQLYRHASHTSKKVGVIAKGSTVKVYKFSHSYAYVKGVNVYPTLNGAWMRIDHLSLAQVK